MNPIHKRSISFGLVKWVIDKKRKENQSPFVTNKHTNILVCSLIYKKNCKLVEVIFRKLFPQLKTLQIYHNFLTQKFYVVIRICCCH